MTKLIWLMLVALIAVNGCMCDVVLNESDREKIILAKPIADDPVKQEPVPVSVPAQPQGQAQEPGQGQARVEEPSASGIVVNPIADINPDDRIPIIQRQLQPIPLIMPNLFQDIFVNNRLFQDADNSNSALSSDVQSESSNDADKDNLVINSQDPNQKHGILSILIVKTVKSNNDDQSNTNGDQSVLSSSDLDQQKTAFGDFIVSNILPKLNSLLGQKDDDSLSLTADTEPKLIGLDDLDQSKQEANLLGGKSDPDNSGFRFPFVFGRNDDGDEDSSEDKDSSEEKDDDSHEELDNSKSPSQKDHHRHHSGSFFSSLFGLSSRNENNQQDENDRPSFLLRTDDGSQAIISNDFGHGHGDGHRHRKKCMMLSFMRLKASIYYRTIIHLLFISGVILFILFMSILTVRFYKRRRALRFYSQNMRVATIDSAISYDDLPGKKDQNSNRFFLFRLGNLRSSYAQKLVDSDSNRSGSLLVNAPPAYDQVFDQPAAAATGSSPSSLRNTGLTSAVRFAKRSSLINSLASAYRNRYGRINTSTLTSSSLATPAEIRPTTTTSNADDATANDDRKSVSSLPAYDEALIKNSQQI